MSDNDLIRRGDALECCDAIDIAALPAVTVRVPEATVYRAVLDWIRDDAGAAVKMSMTPDRANALTARILAALDLTPAPDDLEPCGRCMGSGYGGHPDSGVLCFDCNGTGGVKPAPTAGERLIGAAKEALAMAQQRDGFGRPVNPAEPQPAPDAQAVRDAALREAAHAADEHTFGGPAVRDAILALIGKEGA